jgi:hypothetical protein
MTDVADQLALAGLRDLCARWDVSVETHGAGLSARRRPVSSRHR